MASDDLTSDGILFMADWRRLYPDAPPLSHHFKWCLPKRWMRLHSLPDGKRYADDKAESDIILARQNAVIDHLVPQEQPIQILFTRIETDSHIFISFDLTRLGVIYNAGDERGYDLWMLNDIWQSGDYNVLLTMIADDEIEAFIMAPDCLIAPYDGGIDLILKDAHTAHAVKRQFADWLSQRDDGL
jgi:hypothetical protein